MTHAGSRPEGLPMGKLEGSGVAMEFAEQDCAGPKEKIDGMIVGLEKELEDREVE
jgi:hypothetical protein